MATRTWCARVRSATSSGAGSARQSGQATVWAAIGSDRRTPECLKGSSSVEIKNGQMITVFHIKKRELTGFVVDMTETEQQMFL